MAYKKGFLDGMNLQGMMMGEEEIDENQFKKLGVSNIIDKVIEKLDEV